MITSARRLRSERLSDASVVTGVADIVGARHEVLPPRRRTGDERLLASVPGAASP